jgi:CRISPR/Cas system CSM-associated protein Csm3 (group 7 of RAMP superfamily)
MEDKSQYRYRFISRIVIEAVTPIAVGSGDKDIITDARVIKDVNGLPYIPGTSLAGVLRHAVGENGSNSPFWGFQDNNGGRGSEIIFSNANLVNSDGVAVDGFVDTNNEFLRHYMNLPIRQHAKINDKGTAAKTGKFDEEIVFKGSRFCFEIEVLSEEKKEHLMNDIIAQLYKGSFRLGGGTRSGFGEMKVVWCKKRLLDMNAADERKIYLDKSSSLSDSSFWKDIKGENNGTDADKGWTKYELNLKPDNFFLFGSGFGNDDADMTPVTESCVNWTGTEAKFVDNNILIPATSVKGALAHRVAFYYNQLTGYMADQNEPEDYKNHVGNKNDAVVALFGTEDTGDPNIQRGNVMISDVIQKTPDCKKHEKILNHVSIDRFTGGAIDGALFSESVTDGRESEFSLRIMVNDKVLEKEPVKESFEKALNDIRSGMLPLGGGVNRGNGIFIEIKKVEE